VTGTEAIALKLCECGCGKRVPAHKQNRRFIRGHLRDWLTRSCCDPARYHARYLREWRRQRFDSMTQDEKAAKEERIRRSRFGGRPPWNKGKKNGIVPWNFGEERMTEVKEKIGKAVKAAWVNGKYSDRESRKGSMGPEWKGDLCSDDSGRTRARKRYPSIGICERCEVKEAKHRHHIDGNTRNNKRENLEFLCPRCHKKAHRH